jgi:hypothetical protein
VDEQQVKDPVDDAKVSTDKPTPEEAELQEAKAADRKAIEDVTRAASLDKRQPDRPGS